MVGPRQPKFRLQQMSREKVTSRPGSVQSLEWRTSRADTLGAEEIEMDSTTSLVV